MNTTSESTVRGCHYVLPANHVGITDDAVGHYLRVFQNACGVADYARYKYLAIRYLRVTPDLPLMFMSHVSGFDGVRLRSHLQD